MSATPRLGFVSLNDYLKTIFPREVRRATPAEWYAFFWREYGAEFADKMAAHARAEWEATFLGEGI